MERMTARWWRRDVEFSSLVNVDLRRSADVYMVKSLTQTGEDERSVVAQRHKLIRYAQHAYAETMETSLVWTRFAMEYGRTGPGPGPSFLAVD